MGDQPNKGPLTESDLKSLHSEDLLTFLRRNLSESTGKSEDECDIQTSIALYDIEKSREESEKIYNALRRVRDSISSFINYVENRRLKHKESFEVISEHERAIDLGRNYDKRMAELFDLLGKLGRTSFRARLCWHSLRECFKLAAKQPHTEPLVNLYIFRSIFSVITKDFENAPIARREDLESRSGKRGRPMGIPEMNLWDRIMHTGITELNAAELLVKANVLSLKPYRQIRNSLRLVLVGESPDDSHRGRVAREYERFRKALRRGRTRLRPNQS